VRGGSNWIVGFIGGSGGGTRILYLSCERLRAAAREPKTPPEQAKLHKPRDPWSWVKGSAGEKEARGYFPKNDLLALVSRDLINRQSLRALDFRSAQLSN